MLWHVVELAPLDGTDPATQVRSIEAELERFDPELMNWSRWLVLTKSDLMLPEEVERTVQQVLTDLGWQAPHYVVSALNGEGLDALKADTMNAVEALTDQEKSEAGSETGESQVGPWDSPDSKTAENQDSA